MNTFPKQEHLYGEKIITRLYEQGNVFMSYPFRVVYILAEENEGIPVRVMVSVPKKRFKLAVKRNKIKRLTREVYRLNKSEFVSFACINQLKIHIAFQYISNDIESFEVLDRKMKNTLQKLMHIFEEQQKQPDENA